MTIDEAIKHCLEVVEQNEAKAEKMGRQLIGSAMDKYATDCRECAADHKQLAEWLIQLKKAKQLLKAAVDDINFYVDCCDTHCDECCCDPDNHCHWKHEAEVLALIGGNEGDVRRSY